MWSIYFPHEIYVCAIWGHSIISTNSGDSYWGTNCPPPIVDWLIYCYESDFMSYIHKSKRLISKTCFSTIPFDILTIYSQSTTLNLRNIFPIYPTELQLRKANHSDKETSFLDLNNDKKKNGSHIHTHVYNKHNDFGFPIAYFPWLRGDVHKLLSYGIYISQLVRYARWCTSVFDFHSKDLQQWW